MKEKEPSFLKVILLYAAMLITDLKFARSEIQSFKAYWKRINSPLTPEEAAMAGKPFYAIPARFKPPAVWHTQ